MAEHRLNHLKKRLVKDPNLFAKYSDVMDELVKKGYSRKVPENLINQPQQPLWYLPHHPVLNPNKPDKVRVVFDCAAKYRGTSLNDQLLQGPDLTNSLVGVLLRFRENPVALKFCDMEFNDAAVESKLEMSVEDSRALGIMEGSAQLKKGR